MEERPPGRTARLLGWALAANALAMLAASALGTTAREAAERFALWCGIG